jgi:hypothetical protein
MDKAVFLAHLDKHVPAGSSEMIWPLLRDFDFSLKVTRDRITKHGDYRLPPKGHTTHKISVNGTMNSYAFLLTFLHEIAHMHAYARFGRKIKPHGQEWKSTFTEIAIPFLERGMWLPEMEPALRKYFRNPKASSGADPLLTKVLHQLNEEHGLTVEEIPEGALFLLPKFTGRVFRKGEKRRTRYLCKEINTGRSYTIHGLARIELNDEK